MSSEKLITAICSLLFGGWLWLRWHRGRRQLQEHVKEGNGKLAKRKLNREATEVGCPDHLWNTAYFFPDFSPESENTTTRKVLWYLEQATETIEVCLFCLKFPMLEDVLRQKSMENVNVRLITNKPLGLRRRFKNSEIERRHKIHVWWNKLSPNLALDLLHHKFFIIDGKAAMTGSLNWTWSGITQNKENIAITTNPLIVSKFQKEFERLWEESADTKNSSNHNQKKKNPHSAPPHHPDGNEEYAIPVMKLEDKKQPQPPPRGQQQRRSVSMMG